MQHFSQFLSLTGAHVHSCSFSHRSGSASVIETLGLKSVEDSRLSQGHLSMRLAHMGGFNLTPTVSPPHTPLCSHQDYYYVIKLLKPYCKWGTDCFTSSTWGQLSDVWRELVEFSDAAVYKGTYVLKIPSAEWLSSLMLHNYHLVVREQTALW